MGGVVADLEADGVDIDSFTWAEPDLEDVYLRLTGEALGTTAPVAVGEEGER